LSTWLRLKDPDSYGNVPNAIAYRLQSALDDLTPAFVTLQILEHTRKTIQALRERVFKRIGRSALGRIRSLRFPTKLHGQLLVESMLLDRLKAEFSRERDRISNRLRSWQNLTYRPKVGDDRLFSSDVMQWIDYEIDTVATYLQVVRSAFAEYFAAQNTWIMFWLTVIVAILTVFQVVTNNDIAEWVKATFAALRVSIATLWP
jgi:hypothetical protein